MTVLKIILLLLQLVDMLWSYAAKQGDLEKEDEDVLAAATIKILNRTRYAKQLDEVVDHMSDADVASRVRRALAQKAAGQPTK